eukprot:Seg2337.3 transcript_id=Seg2337.3/GoldUCD/mRNA.D3Y31 product="hypothetical protein" protein_id=Seg2337.3/GoldUCD/D3Y31
MADQIRIRFKDSKGEVAGFLRKESDFLQESLQVVRPILREEKQQSCFHSTSSFFTSPKVHFTLLHFLWLLSIRMHGPDISKSAESLSKFLHQFFTDTKDSAYL